METIKFLKENEIEELFTAIKNDRSKHAKRNKAIFYIAKYCALRVSEVGMICISEYDSDLAQIYCKREKGSNNNTIRIININVKNALDDYLQERNNTTVKSPYFFLSQMGNPISRKMLDVLIKKYCRNTSIPKDKHHFHVLKHTRAIELGNSGLDIKDVQWWLGHKNISNTLIYMQFTTKQQESMYMKLQLLERENKYDKNSNEKNTSY